MVYQVHRESGGVDYQTKEPRLNMDRDHKEFDELTELFKTFRANTTKSFIVNQSHPNSAELSVDKKQDFGIDDPSCGFCGTAYNF